MARGRSFSTRLIIAVTLAASAVIAAGLYADYRITRAQLLEELNSGARTAIENTSARLGEVILGIESSVKTMAEALAAIPDEAQAARLLGSVIDSNPYIFASSLALVPAVTGERRGRAPYRYRDEDAGFGEADLADARDPYWEEDWFVLPRASGQATWIEPYFEPTGVQALMTTFSAPLFRPGSGEREFFGVVTADVTLATLGTFLENLTRDSAGFGFLLSAEGVLIGAATTAAVGRGLEDFFPDTPALAGGRWREHARDPVESIPVPCPRREGECRLRLQPINGHPWYLGVAYSERERLRPLQRYAWRSAITGALMLALLVVLVGSVARRLTRPILGLANASAAVARGDLSTPLPAVPGNDEIAELVRSFAGMRDDLARYIDEVERNAAQRSRLEGELAAAAEIQRAMLPQGGEAHLRDRAVELWARLRPARAVGGDLYSYELCADQLRFAVGDVSDKGIVAALFMARAIALIGQWESQPGGDPPNVALAQINDHLSQDNERCMFLTLCLGCLDLKTGVLTFASAGHMAPLLLRDGAARDLEQDRGPPLALQEGLVFPVNETTLRREDRLVLYTDGFDEATNPAGASLGEAAIREAVRGADGLPLDKMGEELFNAVDAFAAGAQQHDDMTLLQIEIPGEPREPLQTDHRSFALDKDLVGASRAWLEGRWHAWGLESDGLEDLRLILEEIVCNVRDHSGLDAREELSLGLELYADHVDLTCADGGKPFDPLSGHPGAELGLATAEAPIGGLGLHLVRRLADELFYRREDGRNILRLRKGLRAADADRP